MMDNSIESQLANWLSKKLGVEITPGNDEPVQIDIQNTSHGILRIQEDDHGVNDEIYTEEASYVIEYIIHEDDNEDFLKKVRSLALTEKHQMLNLRTILYLLKMVLEESFILANLFNQLK